jgi:hypothetical protein
VSTKCSRKVCIGCISISCSLEGILSLADAFAAEGRMSWVSIAIYTVVALLSFYFSPNAITALVICLFFGIFFYQATAASAKRMCVSYIAMCMGADLKDISAHYMQPNKNFWVAVKGGKSTPSTLHTPQMPNSPQLTGAGMVVGILALDRKSEAVVRGCG